MKGERLEYRFSGRRSGKGRVLKGEEDQTMLQTQKHTHIFEDCIMNPSNILKREGNWNII
jgi:hypothetical protein